MAGGKGNRKKVQLGVKPIGGTNIVKSRKMARRITSQFHILQKVKQKALSLPKGEEQEEKLREVEKELQSLGGIDRYQQASVISTQHFKTSKWVLQSLRKIGKLPSSEKLRTLEVGAINDQLYQSPLLDVRAIDINSQLPCIEECDFFDVLPEFSYDVVVCSMVINCVFHPCKRGEMLFRLLCQLKPASILFLILPTRCLTTSHIRSPEHFQTLLEAIGFSLVNPMHNTPHLTFFTLRARSEWSAAYTTIYDNYATINKTENTTTNKKSKKLYSTTSLLSQRSPLWMNVIRQYFSTLIKSAPDAVNALSPYRTERDIEEIPETADFSILLAKEFFRPST